MRSIIALFRRHAGRNSAAAVTGLLLGSLLGCTMILWTNHVIPVVVHEAHEIEGTAPRNGHLDLYIDLDRNRDCPAETSRWLWTWVDHNGERIKQFLPLVNSSTSLSDLGHDQHFILSIPIPPGVWPGQWYYWSKTIEHCSLLPSLFRATIRESSDIPVRILDEVP